MYYLVLASLTKASLKTQMTHFFGKLLFSNVALLLLIHTLPAAIKHRAIICNFWQKKFITGEKSHSNHLYSWLLFGNVDHVSLKFHALFLRTKITVYLKYRYFPPRNIVNHEHRAAKILKILKDNQVTSLAKKHNYVRFWV